MRARTLLAAVSWLTVAMPANALVPQQVLATSNGFVLSEVVVLQGDTLTLTNADPTLWHDLVSSDTYGGVRPFASDVIPPGGQAPVVGVESLAPSTYPFVCSVHEWMVGNLTVVAAG